MNGPAPTPRSSPAPSPPGAYSYASVYNADGIDESLVASMLRLTPLERLRRMDSARRDSIRLQEYGRRAREAAARTVR